MILTFLTFLFSCKLRKFTKLDGTVQVASRQRGISLQCAWKGQIVFQYGGWNCKLLSRYGCLGTKNMIIYQCLKCTPLIFMIRELKLCRMQIEIYWEEKLFSLISLATTNGDSYLKKPRTSKTLVFIDI